MPVSRSGLGQRTLGAVRANIMISFVVAGAQIAIAAVLGRLLLPAEVGLFVLPSVISLLTTLLAQRGMVMALVRAPDILPETRVAALWLSLALGCLSSLLMLGGAGLYAMYGDNDTAHSTIVLFSWAAAAVLCGSLSTLPTALLQSRLRFLEIALAQLAGITVGSGAIAIGMAVAGYGPTSLAVGLFANQFVNAAVLLALVRPSLVYVPGAGRSARALLSASWRLSALRLIDYLWVQLPQLVGAFTLNAAQLGLYNRSQYLADFSLQTTMWRISSVLYPVFGSMVNDPKRLARLVPPLTAVYALLILPGCAWIAIYADMVLVTLLGPNWLSGASVFAILMLAFGVWNLNQPAGAVLEACGWLGVRFCAGALKLAVLMCAIAIATGHGPLGLALAALISAVVTPTLNSISLWRKLGLGGTLPYLHSILPGAVVASAVAGVCWWFRWQTDAILQQPILIMAAGGAVGTLTYVVSFRIAVLGNLRQDIRAIIPTEVAGPWSVSLALRIFNLGPPGAPALAR